VPSLVAAGAQAAGLAGNDVELLRSAVDGFAAGECRLAEAVAREDLARTLAARSDAHRTIAAFEAAYQAYLGIGAHRDVARVRASLRALGVRKRKAAAAPADTGWAGLTRSERAVVDIVALGRTNREAAAELFVSPETINTHLRHAFMKLGIRSRVELARLAAQRDQ
jgi:DNA-binding CsgD family transcriptional regulator